MDFTSAAVLVDYSYYRILPEIFGKTGCPIVPRKKGEFITEAGQNLKVLWPDVTHPVLGTDKIKGIARKVTESIEPVMADLDFRVPAYQKEDSFSRFFDHINYLKDQDLSTEKKLEVQAMLSRIERAFHRVANLFSIVAVSFRKRRGRLLFLGDAGNEVLDAIAIPGNSDYNFVKAAHHGTSFGKAMSNLKTEFLVVSRSKREFPRLKPIHDSYLTDIQFKMILSTEFLHHCLVL
jgi:hypothetical protein